MPPSDSWSVAVVPGAPLLEPALTGHADLGTLRAACRSAVASLISPSDADPPQAVVCIGAGSRSRRHPGGAWGTLGGFGVPVDAPRHHPPGTPSLPLSLTIGRLILDAAGWDGPVVYQEISHEASPGECRALSLALPRTGTSWLVVGDGSTSRTARAPLPFDPRAERFDTAAAEAFRDGRPTGLLALDRLLAEQLGAAGWPTWRMLAEAVPPSARIAADLLYQGAPFGVGYVVAYWRVGRPRFA